MKGSRVKGRGGLENVFAFCALRAPRFSRLLQLDELCGARRCVCLLVTVLTAAFVYPFLLQHFRVLC